MKSCDLDICVLYYFLPLNVSTFLDYFLVNFDNTLIIYSKSSFPDNSLNDKLTLLSPFSLILIFYSKKALFKALASQFIIVIVSKYSQF